tara:strand:+ start:448 stop:1413 length:966 start_codon:yes stop_codon:yes gene_type:complete
MSNQAAPLREPTLVNIIADCIYKYASQSKLSCFRQVQETESKVLCYNYYTETPVNTEKDNHKKHYAHPGRSPNCSHWIKPGDYIQCELPPMDSELFGGTLPTSAKAATVILFDETDQPEHVPDCLACECESAAMSLTRCLNLWVSGYIANRPEDNVQSFVSGYLELDDVFCNYSVDTDEQDMLEGWMSAWWEWGCNIFSNPTGLYEDTTAFDKWTKVIWMKWYDAVLFHHLEQHKETLISQDMWQPVMERMMRQASKTQSEYLEWQRTFFDESNDREEITIQADILLCALKVLPIEVPECVMRHLTSIVDGVPESLIRLTK